MKFAIIIIFSLSLHKKVHYYEASLSTTSPIRWVANLIFQLDVSQFLPIWKSRYLLFCFQFCIFGDKVNQIEGTNFLPELLFPFKEIPFLSPSSMWFLGIGESSINLYHWVGKGVNGIYVGTCPWSSEALRICQLSSLATGQPARTCSPPDEE